MVACLLAGCTAPAPAPQAPAAAPPTFLIGGCAEIDRHDVCEAHDRITVWIGSTSAPAPSLPGWQVSASTYVDGGLRWTLTSSNAGLAPSWLSSGGRDLAVVRRRPKAPAPHAGVPLDTLLAQLDQANPFERLTMSEAARRLLARADRDAEAARIGRLQAQLQRAVGTARGEIRVRSFIAHVLIDRGRIAEAAQQLEAMPRRAAFDANAAIWSMYKDALLSRQRGDLLGAARKLAQMAKVAETVDDHFNARVADQVALPVLNGLGLQRSAQLAEQRLLARSHTLSCRAQRQVLTNVAWSQLVARESKLARSAFGTAGDDASARALTRLLDQVLKLALDCAASPRNSFLNLALDAIQRGDPTTARLYLQRASTERSRRARSATLFEQLLEARVDLRNGLSAESRQMLIALEGKASSPLERWELHTLLGESFIGQDHARAIHHLESAEAALDSGPATASGILHGEWADNLRALRSAKLLADVRLGLGQVDETWELIQRARGRLQKAQTQRFGLQRLSAAVRAKYDAHLGAYYRRLSELRTAKGRRWQTAQSELAALEARIEHLEAEAVQEMAAAIALLPETNTEPSPASTGRIDVTVFPGHERWWLLARSTTTSTAVSIAPRETGEPNPDLMAQALGHVLATTTERDWIRVYSGSGSADVPLHEIRIGGRPLGSLRPVTYALEVGARPGEIPAWTEAVLVGDPAPALEADRELEVAADGLEGIHVSARRAPLGSSVEALLASLEKTSLFHFAGHAQAAPDVFGAALRVGESTWLSAADVLALHRGPSSVVLSGCSTGASGALTDASTLAAAFLTVGAREVLATQEPIESSTALRFASAFYGEDGRFAERLQAVLAGAIERGEPYDALLSYRVWVP